MDKTAETDQAIEALETEIREREAKVKALREAKSKPAASGIPANIIALAKFCDDESDRFALDAIHLTVDDGRYEAACTDARRLAILSGKCDSQPEVSVNIPASVVAGIITANDLGKAPLKRIANLKLSFRPIDGAVTITSSKLGVPGPSVHTKPSEGRFPSYKDVLPTGEPALTIAFSAQMLSEALLLCAEFESDDCVMLELRGKHDPVVIRPVNPVNDEQQLTVVLMPNALDE